MLVLSRKKGEGVVADNNKVITVVEIQPDRVRLQVESPEEYSIQLGEGKQVNRGKDSAAFVFVRRTHESFVINGDLTITIVEIRGDKVRLGAVMPRDYSFHRKEVFDAIHGSSGLS